MTRRKKPPEAEPQATHDDEVTQELAPPSAPSSGFITDGTWYGASPIDMIELVPGVDISFEWLEGERDTPTWRSARFGGRIVPDNEGRINPRSEHRGIRLAEYRDHVELVYKGCVRCVHKSQLRYWGPHAPRFEQESA